MNKRIFTECEKCGTPIYIFTDWKGKKIEVNAQMITLKSAQILYGNNINIMIDRNGDKFHDKDKTGFLQHKYTCKGKK